MPKNARIMAKARQGLNPPNPPAQHTPPNPRSTPCTLIALSGLLTLNPEHFTAPFGARKMGDHAGPEASPWARHNCDT